MRRKLEPQFDGVAREAGWIDLGGVDSDDGLPDSDGGLISRLKISLARPLGGYFIRIYSFTFKVSTP